MIDAAILIVNYRTYEPLTACLASLTPHLRDGDDVVVVDWVQDAVRASAVRAAFPRVTWIGRDDNLGFAAGVNLAARASRAPVLILLNPDTVVEGPLPSMLSDSLAADSAIGVVGPRVLNADGTIQESARQFPGFSTALGGRSTWLTRRFPNNPFTRRNLRTRDAATAGRATVDWLAGSCLATRRDLFTRLAGLDEGFFMYWEDADYCRRVGATGATCVYLPVVTVRHTGGVSSAQNVGPSIRAFHRSAFRLYWKHAGVSRVLAPLVWLGLWLRGEAKVVAARAARVRQGRGTVRGPRAAPR